MENVILVKRDDLEALAARLISAAAPEPDEILTAEQAAQLLRLSYGKVLALAEAGDIPARNVWPRAGRASYRFSRKALIEWVKNHANG